MKRLFFLLSIAVVFNGCAPEVQVLQKQIRDLETNISQLKQENSQCQQNLNTSNSLANTLDHEKESRGKDLTALKAKTRIFIQGEYDTLNRFAKNKELMDYMGGELIARKEKENSNLTVINLDPFPSNSVIYKIKGVFDAGTVVIPQLFRKKDDQIICIWQGPLIEIVSSGAESYEFKTPLNVMKGDFFGFHFPEMVSIPYDTRTGNYSVYGGKVDLGEKIPRTFKDQKRNYSIGVAGFLEEPSS